VFAIFLANKYFPIGYQLWVVVFGYFRPFSQRRCDKTAFFSVLTFVGSSLLAQVVLTLRIYAVTSKNRVISLCFCVITISQFVFGLYWTIFTAVEGAQQALPIPLDAYVVCTFKRHKHLEIGFTVTSLIYDLLAFSVIVYLVVRSNIYNFPIPTLLKTIARDATYYFLLIFTSHVIFVLVLLFAKPTLQLLPGLGSVVYIPVMVTRLLLSLKKASTQEYEWSLGELTTGTVRFAEHRDFATTNDDSIYPDTIASRHEGAQSRGLQHTREAYT